MNPLQQQQAVFKVGIVSETDPATHSARVRFDDLDGLETMRLPVGVHKSMRDKAYWMPDVGEHVACVLDVNAETGVILCSIYSDADQPPVVSQDKYHMRFEDGTWVEYDRSSGEMNVYCVNNITVEAINEVAVKAGVLILLQAPRIVLDGETTITKNLQVNQNIHANIDIVAANSVAALEGGVVLESHRHTEVARGIEVSGPPA